MGRMLEGAGRGLRVGSWQLFPWRAWNCRACGLIVELIVLQSAGRVVVVWIAAGMTVCHCGGGRVQQPAKRVSLYFRGVCEGEERI